MGHFDLPRFPYSELQRLDLTHLQQNYIILQSKMHLIQTLKFRTLKTGCFKIPCLQMTVFQTGITVASGQSVIQLFWSPKNCIWAFKEYHQLQMLHFQMGFTVAPGQYVMFRLPFILAHNLLFYYCIGALKKGWTIESMYVVGHKLLNLQHSNGTSFCWIKHLAMDCNTGCWLQVQPMTK